MPEAKTEPEFGIPNSTQLSFREVVFIAASLEDPLSLVLSRLLVSNAH